MTEIVDTSRLPIEKRDTLEEMRAAWEATHTYRVIRDDAPDGLTAKHRRTVLAAGLRWRDAKRMCEEGQAVISALDPFTAIGGSMNRSIYSCELETPDEPVRLCACGCGVAVQGKAMTATPACRKRL